ncbi:MAG: nuclear transport factor 2 family protein [Fluviicola sp.]|nr:nuclear transport factor 2 family protein [Fluviicola sp.]
MTLNLKSIAITFVLLAGLSSCSSECNKPEEETVDIAAEKEAVTSVMKSYKDAIQGLTTEGTLELFTKEATVFESGGSEGTYEEYVSHHLGPELDYFNSFEFSDYKVSVEVDMPYAFVTESYIYTIEIKPESDSEDEPRVIKQKGVATSTLKKIDDQWKITKTHSSARSANSSH